jgi:tetratricopeptide (TPR) repeat protein
LKNGIVVNKNMKKSLIVIFAALFLIGCQNAVQQPATVTNSNTAQAKTVDSDIVSSHSTNTAVASPTTSSRSASTESPMAKPIDVTDMTADIDKAKKEFEKSPNDAKTKTELAKAYFVRATALTTAAQYRAALGDYRKGLKLDPTDEAAKEMHDQILTIFKSIGREPPKEGEEPAPMPFGK